MMTRLAGFLFLCAVFLVPPGRAEAADPRDDAGDEGTWSWLLGYGQTIPGFGNTKERLKTLEVIPRYGKLIREFEAGNWFERQDFWLELPVSVLLDDTLGEKPGNDYGVIGLNFLTAFHFRPIDRWQPYVFAGGGPVLVAATIDGMGSDFNGSYGAGVGVSYETKAGRQLRFECRYHHISNGGLRDPNVPLNAVKLFFSFQ